MSRACGQSQVRSRRPKLALAGTCQPPPRQGRGGARWLNKAQAWLDQYRDGMPSRAEEESGLHYHNWLEAHVLRREAEADSVHWSRPIARMVLSLRMVDPCPWAWGAIQTRSWAAVQSRLVATCRDARGPRASPSWAFPIQHFRSAAEAPQASSPDSWVEAHHFRPSKLDFA